MKKNRTTSYALIFAIMLTVAAVTSAETQPVEGESLGPKGAPGPAIKALWEAEKAPAYPSASAHDPKYGDKQLWPALSGKEYFLKQQWPKGRLYVWAKPGQSGLAGQRNNLDPTDPANWLEDGKPATKLVFDENADLVLPSSTNSYVVGLRGSSMREVFRHVTVEPGAGFIGGGDGVGRQIYGNVWVKRGGKMYAQGATHFLGGGHTFFRADNDVSMNRGKNGYTMYSQYFQFSKGEQTSVEFFGHVTLLDEFFCNSMVIVSQDSWLQPGRAASPAIRKTGTLVLMDGAFWGKWLNEFSRNIDLTLEGTLQGGLPERPLTRDAHVGISFRNWQKLDFSKWSGDPQKGIRDGRMVSMNVRPGATIKSVSADPAKAALVLTWAGNQPNHGDKADPDFVKQYDSIPRKITIYFDEKTTVDGVRFENVHLGGLLLRNMAVKDAWKNVSYGKSNMGEPKDLFKVVDIGRYNDW